MPSWFSKVFKNDAGKPKSTGTAAVASPTPREVPKPPQPQPQSSEPQRKVVYAQVVEENVAQSTWSSDIRIKARVEKGGGSCVLLVDRPVLEGHSAWFASRSAAGDSPLAQALFAIDGVESVLIHGMTVTVHRRPTLRGDWLDLAQEIGSCIRRHLIEGLPVVVDAFLQSLPTEKAIQEKLQFVVDSEINPNIAAHSGAIRLDRVEGNTVYLEMLGGCQGCAASAVTLRQGIFEAFRSAVPGVGAILDVTDHTAGKNPFYKELPAGMS